MPRYVAWLPCWASVEYELITDEEITDEAELRERMLTDGSATGGLCHQCAEHIQCDGDYDEEVARDTECPFAVVEE